MNELPRTIAKTIETATKFSSLFCSLYNFSLKNSTQFTSSSNCSYDRVATVLEIREIKEKSWKVKKSWNSQAKVREFEKNEESWRKVRKFKQLSKSKSLTLPYVQSDDLSFYQNAVSRSQKNSLRSGKSQGRWKSGKSGRPVTGTLSKKGQPGRRGGQQGNLDRNGVKAEWISICQPLRPLDLVMLLKLPNFLEETLALIVLASVGLTKEHCSN